MPVQELDVLSQEQSEAILQEYSTVEGWQSYLEGAFDDILDSHILEFPEHCIGWELAHMSAFDDALHSESCSGLLGEIHGIDFKGYVGGLPEDFAQGCTYLSSLEVRGFMRDFAHFAEDVHVENITFRGSLPGLDQERFEFAYQPDISLPTWEHLKSISFIDIRFKSLQGAALSVERLHVENAFYYQPVAIPVRHYYHPSEWGTQLPGSERIPHAPHVSTMPNLKDMKFANVSANHIMHWLGYMYRHDVIAPGYGGSKYTIDRVLASLESIEFDVEYDASTTGFWSGPAWAKSVRYLAAVDGLKHFTLNIIPPADGDIFLEGCMMNQNLLKSITINVGEGGTLVLSDHGLGTRMSTESLIINTPVVKAERGRTLDFSGIIAHPAAGLELLNQFESLKICADLKHVERIKSRSLREIQLGDEDTTDSPADKLTLECEGLEKLKVFNTLKAIEVRCCSIWTILAMQVGGSINSRRYNTSFTYY